MISLEKNEGRIEKVQEVCEVIIQVHALIGGDRGASGTGWPGDTVFDNTGICCLRNVFDMY